MNLKEFKIKSETDESFHLGHPKGKVFHFDKKKLSPKAVKMIQKMCAGGDVKGYDEGGGVEQDVRVDPQGPLMSLFGSGQVPQDSPQAQTPNAQPQISPEQLQLAQSQVSKANVPNTAIQDPQTPTQTQTQPTALDPVLQANAQTNGALNRQENDIKGFKNEIKTQGDVTNKAFEDYQQKMAAQPSPLDVYNQRKTQDDALLKHYMDNNIDPNRYVHNLSTGSKVLAGIAMALSGAGAGKGGQNLAFDHLQKAISNDVDSQKMDQEKSLNTYKLNRQAGQDEMQSHLATQNQLWTGVQAKIAQAGAQATNAQSRLQASQLVSQIEQEKAQNRIKMSALTQGSGGGANPSDPLNLVPVLVPEAHQKDAIHEIGQAKAASQNEDQMLKLFDQASKENTALRTGAGLLRTPGSILSLRALGSPLIHDMDGRVNEFEQRNLEGLFPQPGDLDSKIQEKKEGLKQFINLKKAAPTAKTYGINIDNFTSTGPNAVLRLPPQQQQYYAWAKANPNSDIAKAFFAKTGLK